MIKKLNVSGWSKGGVWDFMKAMGMRTNDTTWEGLEAGEWLCTGATIMAGRTTLVLEFERIDPNLERGYQTFSVASFLVLEPTSNDA